MSDPHEPTAQPAVHLPASTTWPFALAGGVSLLLFGIVTSYALSAVGVLLLALALAGWIGELVRDDGHG